jgi:hypothetical protein
LGINGGVRRTRGCHPERANYTSTTQTVHPVPPMMLMSFICSCKNKIGAKLHIFIAYIEYSLRKEQRRRPLRHLGMSRGDGECAVCERTWFEIG